MYAGLRLACLALLSGLASTLIVAMANNASPVAWQPSIEIATGRGERGPWQQNESRYDFVDDASVAMDERGNIAVVWVDQARKAVLFQRYTAEGRKQLDQPADVSRDPQTLSWLPRVALAPDASRRVFVLWQEIIFSGGSHGGDILFASSDDGGKSFAQPINLTRSVAGEGKARINREVWHNGSLDLVAGPQGTLYVAWTEYEGNLWFSRSNDGGKSFAQPRRVAGGGNANPARAPALALGPDRAVYLAWTVGENDAADIHVARSTDGGASFGQPLIVAPSKNYSDAPKLAVDSAGTVHLVYAESSGGPFERFQIRYTRSTDGARSFEPSRDISSAMAQPFRSASFPAVAADGKGRLYILWELFADARQRPRGLGVAVSPDGGRTFAPPGVVPGSIDPGGGFNGSSQGMLMKKLAVNQAGAVAVVNSSLKQDAYSRVWLIRGEMPR